MAVIFSASSDTQSFQHSSRIVAPLLHWLFPHLSAQTADAVAFAVRKVAHLTEFAIFGLLLWRALRKPVRRDPRPWSWPQARNALLLVILYAASDEFHQLFVPTRQASIVDVLIDTTGAALGLGALWLIGRWRKQW
jgi:VanZ family protein